jgi:hypothetical protein
MAQSFAFDIKIHYLDHCLIFSVTFPLPSAAALDMSHEIQTEDAFLGRPDEES